ncbi:hypothetical protein TRIUR3_24994 [Triticum urartu]|uniref:Uncharacterized protein n=1 Tax=Triticum urartu TaxID=4572 RepID=M7ZG62_TRIUA|nr:hypothetical protein TRIUR3_24994 [Triticum urartu]
MANSGEKKKGPRALVGNEAWGEAGESKKAGPIGPRGYAEAALSSSCTPPQIIPPPPFKLQNPKGGRRLRRSRLTRIPPALGRAFLFGTDLNADR